MLEIKERGNDNFLCHVRTPKTFKQLVSKGYIKEIGNTLLLYNQETELWVLTNSNFTTVVINEPVRHDRLWDIWYYKIYGVFFKKQKFKRKFLPNQIEISRDQISYVVQVLTVKELDFKSFYLEVREQLSLPPYVLPDDSIFEKRKIKKRR